MGESMTREEAEKYISDIESRGYEKYDADLKSGTVLVDEEFYSEQSKLLFAIDFVLSNKLRQKHLQNLALNSGIKKIKPTIKNGVGGFKFITEDDSFEMFSLAKMLFKNENKGSSYLKENVGNCHMTVFKLCLDAYLQGTDKDMHGVIGDISVATSPEYKILHSFIDAGDLIYDSNMKVAISKNFYEKVCMPNPKARYSPKSVHEILQHMNEFDLSMDWCVFLMTSPYNELDDSQQGRE